MSDVGLSEAVGAGADLASPAEITAGTMMRNAREAAGLHVAALAVSMKIPVKKLEALEADRLDLLHDAVFVRALAASVCRALKIDPAPILIKLPLNAAPRLNPDERGINAPFHSPNDASGLAIPELLVKPSSLFVLALVVAGVAVFFFPDIKVPDVSGDLVSQATRSSDNQVPPQAAQSTPQVFESSPEPVVATASAAHVMGEGVALPPVPVPSAVAETPFVKASTSTTPLVTASQPAVVASRPVPVASRPFAAPSVPAAIASRPVSAPLLPSTGTVVFKAKGATWVKVVDAKGTVQLSKTLAEGEVVGASGATPLSVVVGRVDATEVEVRGQTFSLAGVAKDNVARFEVK
ncbi:MAG: RodZ domain-containing protein [Pseudomonadota bacterium]